MNFSPLIKRILVDLSANRVYLKPGEKPPKGVRLHKGIRKATARWYSPIKNDVPLQENINSILHHISKSSELRKKIYAHRHKAHKDNAWSTILADYLGYHAPPKIISEEEFAKLEEDPNIITMRRGVGGASTPDFIAGKNKIQRHGAYGAGCYTAATDWAMHLDPAGLGIPDIWTFKKPSKELYFPDYFDRDKIEISKTDFILGVEGLIKEVDERRRTLDQNKKSIEVYKYLISVGVPQMRDIITNASDKYSDDIEVSRIDGSIPDIVSDMCKDMRDAYFTALGERKNTAVQIYEMCNDDEFARTIISYLAEYHYSVIDDMYQNVNILTRSINTKYYFDENYGRWDRDYNNSKTMGDIKENLLSVFDRVLGELEESILNTESNMPSYTTSLERSKEHVKSVFYDAGLDMPEELVNYPLKDLKDHNIPMIEMRDATSAKNVARSYGEQILKMALDPSANIINYRELEDWFPDEKQFGLPEGNLGSFSSDFVNAAIRDEGLKALLQGYDAVRIPRSNTNADEADYILVLNRGKIIMVDPTKSDAS